MPTENAQKTEDLIDVGEEKGAEINLDNQGEPEKVETPVEEKIEIEKVEDKTYENERETKVDKKEDEPEMWKHFCEVECSDMMIGKGEACNWCGEEENASRS